MAVTTMRLDLVVTPLAASQLEAIQAIKAAEMVAQFGRVVLRRGYGNQRTLAREALHLAWSHWIH